MGRDPSFCHSFQQLGETHTPKSPSAKAAYANLSFSPLGFCAELTPQQCKVSGGRGLAAWINHPRFPGVCLRVGLFICLFVCLSVYLFVCLSVCLFVCFFVCFVVCLFARSFVRSFVCSRVCAPGGIQVEFPPQGRVFK